MSRVAAGDVIEIKPSNNMYTTLVIVAFLVELIAFLVMFLKAADVFDKGLFS
jgi:hypothetical protein